MKKTKIKKDYQFFIILILCFWLFLALIVIFSSGAYRKFSLLTDIKLDHKFPLSHSYLAEKDLYSLNDYKFDSFHFSSNGESFALIEEVNNEECIILNTKNLGCYDKINDLIFSPNGNSFAYIAKSKGKVKAVVNGESSKLYDWIFPPYFFSDDGHVFVFRVRKGVNERVLVNNLESREFDRVLRVFQVNEEKTIVYYALLNNVLWRGEITW